MPQRHYRCRFCGAVLPAWLPAAKRLNGAMLLGHLSQQHSDQVKPYVDRMRRTAAEAFEVVEEDETQ